MSRELLYTHQFVPPPLEQEYASEADRRLAKHRFKQYYEAQLGRPIYRGTDKLLINPTEGPLVARQLRDPHGPGPEEGTSGTLATIPRQVAARSGGGGGGGGGQQGGG